MANRYISGVTASGTWLGATGGTFCWDNFSTLGYPSTIDIVYASGKTITIDSGITVNTITNGLYPGGSFAGGLFLMSINTTINTNISGGTLTCLTTSHNVGEIRINGNVVGGTANNAHAITHSGLGTLSISGDVTGGSALTVFGISIANTGGLDINNCPKVYITGNTLGGTNASTTPAIFSTAICYVEVNGNISASTVYPSIQMTNQKALLVVKGNIVSVNGNTPFYGFNIKCSPFSATSFSSNQQNYIIQDTSVSSANTTFSTSAYTYGMPNTSDVRYGIKYGYLSGLTGTMVIPPFSAVSVGFSVDDGTGIGGVNYGTAITSIRDIGNMLAGYIG